MRVKERRFGRTIVFDLAGPIAGSGACDAFRRAVDQGLALGARTLIANLSGVPSIGLDGLNALVDGFRAMRRAGGVLRLAGLTDRIHDLVVITRLVTVFDTFDTVEQAMAGQGPVERPAEAPAFAYGPAAFVSLQRMLRRA